MKTMVIADKRDAFRKLIGVKTISDFMGYNANYCQRVFIPYMLDKGLAWKRGAGRPHNLVITTPFLINMFYMSWYKDQRESLIKER